MEKNNLLRLNPEEAQLCYSLWGDIRWEERTLYSILKKGINKQEIPKVPLNEPLLKSIKQNGFINPFLLLDSSYPLVGSQRLRCALEFPIKKQKSIKIKACTLVKPSWSIIELYPDPQKVLVGLEMHMAMAEAAFKTLFYHEHSEGGENMIQHEIYGDKLHWEARDGVKK